MFDRVRTCDNHCEFCFIYQLPQGMRRSLYLKDDDYRLSFLYGNFTTLTRFTEADLERRAHRAPLAVVRVDPRHGSRRALRHAEQPAGGDEPALAAGAARPRHRGARPDRGVPGSQRRGGLRATRCAACSTSTRSSSRCGRGAARPEPLQHRTGDAPAHRGRGRGGGRPASRSGRRSSSPRSGAAWCSPPTSTT